VLVVDDDPGSRSVLGDYLSARGHDVTTASDAEAAWDGFQLQPFPIVMVDWLLPGIDGLQLCRRIRSTPRGETTVILVVTGLDQPEHLSAVLEAAPTITSRSR